MQMKIKVHASISKDGSASSATGPLYLQVEDDYFPHEGAKTYVIVVLCWWMQNAMALMLAESEVKNITMDTASTCRMRRAAGSDDLTVVLYDGNARPYAQHIVSFKRYLAGLRGAAKSVLNELATRGLDRTSDADALRDQLLQLESLEADIKQRGLP
jgi:hypothetical protein